MYSLALSGGLVCFLFLSPLLFRLLVPLCICPLYSLRRPLYIIFYEYICSAYP